MGSRQRSFCRSLRSNGLRHEAKARRLRSTGYILASFGKVGISYRAAYRATVSPSVLLVDDGRPTSKSLVRLRLESRLWAGTVALIGAAEVAYNGSLEISSDVRCDAAKFAIARSILACFEGKEISSMATLPLELPDDLREFIWMSMEWALWACRWQKQMLAS